MQVGESCDRTGRWRGYYLSGVEEGRRSRLVLMPSVNPYSREHNPHAIVHFITATEVIALDKETAAPNSIRKRNTVPSAMYVAPQHGCGKATSVY
jgi:hypothetical protein